MNKQPSIAFGVVLLAGLAGLATAGEPSARVLGDGIELQRATPIPVLIAAPQEHAGEKVRIDGIVTDVCRINGCWVKVSSPRGGSGILVQVEDSKIVFPPDAVAGRVSVEGVFEAVAHDAPPDAARDASSDGEDEPHVCDAMTRDGLRYRLRASGAILH